MRAQPLSANAILTHQERSPVTCQKFAEFVKFLYICKDFQLFNKNTFMNGNKRVVTCSKAVV